MTKPATKAKTPKPRGLRAIDWIEKSCLIPEGRLIGQPFKLTSWQKKIIHEIYDTPTRRAIISVGRKNGKTALAAALLLLHLCGPEAIPNSQLYSAAQSRDQAGLIFGLAAKIVRMSPRLQGFVDIKETAKVLTFPHLGTMYRALSAEASTAYGLSPVFTIHDELGQVKGPRSELYEALETATAAQEAPLSIIISTQAPTNADLLSIIIDDARTKADKRTKLFIWETPKDIANPFTDAAIKAANPAFEDFQNKDEVRAMAADAKRMPTKEAEFRNLILNQRVQASNPFVSRTVWDSCGGDVLKDLEGIPLWGGLDLSEVRDLTALVLVGKYQGKWHVNPTFWLPHDTLYERAHLDRVPYDVWNKQGFLATTPGKSIEYEWVATYLLELFSKYDVRKIAFDRWNFRHLRPWLLSVGFTEEKIENKFVEFGQGYVSMSPALRELEGKLLNGLVAHGNHPVLDMCAENAVVQIDPAGNRKLTKAKSHGRIDGMVALAMALSVAVTEEEVKKPTYQMIFA